VLAGLVDALAMIVRSDDREPREARETMGAKGPRQESQLSDPSPQEAGGRFAEQER
jgi:hypothetical protein